MRRRKGCVVPPATAALVMVTAVFGGAATDPLIVADEPNFHDGSSQSANRKGRMRQRHNIPNHLSEEQNRNLGLLADLQNNHHTSTKNAEEAMVAGRSESRHRIRRHNGDDLESILAKFFAAEPVNAAAQTDISQMAKGRRPDSSTVYSSELFPRGGHQQLKLKGDVITVQTTQADIPTDFIVGPNNQVFDTSSGQPVAVANVFWDLSTNGFINSNGQVIPVDISVEYVSDSGSYFSGDSSQGQYEVRGRELYYIRADGAVIDTGFTIEAGSNELIFINGDGSVDRTGVQYRESDNQFILASSGQVVQFEITTETITIVEDKVTEEQIVVETGAGNVIIEENSDADGGVVGGDGDGNGNGGSGGGDDSSDDDCKSKSKSTVQSHRGKGRSSRSGGKGRHRRHRSRGKGKGKGKGKGRSYSKSKKKSSSKSKKSSQSRGKGEGKGGSYSKSKKKSSSKSKKSGKGPRRLAETDTDDEEVGNLQRYLKSSKGSSHSSKSSHSGKGKGRSYSGKGGGKGYSSSSSKTKKVNRKKKKDRCD